jgi:hypothetical protein
LFRPHDETTEIEVEDLYRQVGIAAGIQSTASEGFPDAGAFPGTDPENYAEVFTPI